VNEIFQIIGTFASIFSIPLAIILYLKASGAKQNKVRLEIIRALSYRLGESKSLNKVEVTAVFNTKIREYRIRKPHFTEITILEDIIADAVSNPFLLSDQKTAAIDNIEIIIRSYEVSGHSESGEGSTSLEVTKIEKIKVDNKFAQKHLEILRLFTLIAATLSAIVAVLFYASEDFIEALEFFSGLSEFFIGILTSLLVAIIASALGTVAFIIKNRKK